ncbi:hypothetical protein BS78_04G158000 [Paspalum vaginatum]|nr:hypothetical protein BS78_04G158000 [Paspalum vaginatum]
MAEPVEDTAATPPPLPQGTEATEPAAVAEPSTEATTPTPLASESVTIGDGALVAAKPSLPQELPEAAVAGQPQPTMTEADGQKPTPTEAPGAAESPPAAETTPAQESAAPAAPTPQQVPQKQEGDAPEQAETPARRRWRRLHAAVRVVFRRSKSAPPQGDHDSSAQEKEEMARRRWRLLRAAVLLLFHRPKGARGHGDQSTLPSEDKGGEAKAPVSGKPAPAEMSIPEDSTPAQPAVERGEEEKKASVPDGKKPASGQDELKPPAEKKPSRKDSAGAPVSAETAAREEKLPARRRWSLLRTAVRLLFHRPKGDAPGRHGDQITLASDEKGREAKAPVEGDKEGSKSKRTDGEKGDQTKPGAEKTNWPEEEKRLEGILEEAFTRLLATEYWQLGSTRKKCLLTFSVFDLDSEVKKQAMIYWWVADLDLRLQGDTAEPTPHAAPPSPARRRGKTIGRLLPNFDRPPWARNRNRRTAAPAPAPPSPVQVQRGSKADSDDAQDAFSKLSDGGFLVPAKNWCSNVIHGCKVNPLAHWMVKWLARGDGFADLDAKGYPEKLPTHSSILCLTADNRADLQKLRVADGSLLAGKKPKATNQASLEKVPTTKDEPKVGNKSQAIEKTPSQQDQAQGPQNTQQPSLEQEQHVNQIIEQLFKGRRVILNIDAHVYPIPVSAFTHLVECLVVLQLGRWRSIDDKTYMEVDKLESLDGIGSLKNLRYLGLRGLARLTKLPEGIQSLNKLAILDMRGCQNLFKLEAQKFTQLKQLTHLDLTECYMLEHIGREIASSLSELQVFKGFVFAPGKQGSTTCRLQDLRKLKKLQKLTISVTTDANVHADEMAALKNFTALRKLTITWGEIPSILERDPRKKNEREELLRGWTNFELPGGLVKLDLRCYPRKELQLRVHKNLRKLYLRGGGLTKFSIVSDGSKSSIKTLRLRYLKNLSMKWADIRSASEDIEQVEIVVSNKDERQEKDKKGVEDEWNPAALEIPPFTLEQHGVWTRDKKEEENNPTKNEVDNDSQKADPGAIEKIKGASGPTEEDSSTNKTASATTVESKKDDNDVSKEQAAGTNS